MAKIIIRYIIVFFALFSPVFAEIIQTDRMEEILPYIDKNTWVLFGVDGMEEICAVFEPEMPVIVQQAQASANAVFGLTALNPPISVAALKRLAYVGIDFTFSAPYCPNLEIQSPIHWEEGVLFISDFSRKADVFRKWFEMAQFRPSKIVIIDEGEPHLIEMDKEMAEMNIPCTCFQYVKTF